MEFVTHKNNTNNNNCWSPYGAPIEDAWGPPGLIGKQLLGTSPSPCTVIAPETEEEYDGYYQDKISYSQNRQLYPLKEDLADWINKTLDTDYLTPDNLLDMLDNGVILWQLAGYIQQKAQQAFDEASIKSPVPTISPRCFRTAARKSFFSRDNVEKFIHFCKKLGVHQHLLFETDDLVLQNQPRNVILCLMEVSRLASKYRIEPPGLVKIEHEIAEEESQHDSGLSHGSVTSWNLPTPKCTPLKTYSSSALDKTIDENGNERLIKRTTSESGCETGMIEKERNINGKYKYTNEDEWSRASSEDRCSVDTDKGVTSNDDLDKKVKRATNIIKKQCTCSGDKCGKLKIKKVGEGRYNIAGRNVFIRLLKGRHMMVRVGGGWDTLENFLARHDPCQQVARAVSRNSRNSSPIPSCSSNRRSSTPI